MVDRFRHARARRRQALATMQWNLDSNGNKSLSILCLGAHADDIEIGCGGTVLHLLRNYKNCRITWVVFSGNSQRRREALSSAKRFLNDARRHTVMIRRFKESFFPYRGEQIKGVFERLKKEETPDIIFTHYRQDLHQDHRMICEFTWNTFRQHQILEYEIPKYDGDVGQPNVYVPLSRDVCVTKVGYVMEEFASQRGKHWFTADTFFSLLRLRGIESNGGCQFAEAFYGRKLIVG